MDFTVEPSLVHQASIAVVSSLWCREFYLHKIFQKFPDEKFLVQQNHRAWLKKQGSNIAMHLEDLAIPKTIKQHLLNIFLPIGQQIFKWLESHAFLNLHNTRLSELLIWSPRGTINSEATAQNILEKKMFFTKLDRFSTACNNCMYEELLQLWPEVEFHFNFPENNKFITDMAVTFWVHHFKGEVQKLMMFMEYEGVCSIEFASWTAVESNNYVFAKYFTEQLKSYKLVRIIKNLYNGLILKRFENNPLLVVYLLSRLSEQDQMDIFIKKPATNLLLFINWPLQNYFLELANMLWNSLTPFDFCIVLEELVRKVSEYHWGPMYKDLFMEFWNSAPLMLKNYVIDKIILTSFLSRIFSFTNTDIIINFLLGQLSPPKKLEMLFGFHGRQVISFLLSKNRMTSLELLIKNCIATRDEIDALDKIYLEHEEKQPSYIVVTEDALNEFHRVLKNISERLH